MEQKKEQRQIELLKILAKGCKKHPAYRAIRKATERCEECVVVWQAKVELNKLIKLWGIKNIILFYSEAGLGQTIQRIGRALRKKYNDDTQATIYDFILKDKDGKIISDTDQTRNKYIQILSEL